MNYRMIGKLLGNVLRFVALFMLPAAAISLVNREYAAAAAFAITIVLMLLLYGLSRLRPPKRLTMYPRDGFAVVALTWFVVSLLGCLPFWISGAIPSFVDSLFEIVSGFTTTGASILKDVEALPMGILYWRSFSHWLGGMGVLVFLLAIAPLTTAGSGDTLHIMRAESPGPQVSKLVPHTLESARILYGIYIVMTIVETVLLLLGGMSVFDAVCTAFGTAGTGGFAVRNTSMIAYSPYLQWVVTIFMALFGVNFGVYYLLLHRSFKQAAHNEEMRLYLGTMLAAGFLIFLNILPSFASAADALRHSFFQVSSIMTTTGFATADFDTWPQFSRAILVALMIMGASAGSTGGGIKCSRVLICIKKLHQEIKRMLYPNTVTRVHMDGEVIPPETVTNTFAYLCAYCLIAILSIILLALDGFSFETNVTAILATLNNIGPGLGAVGPMCNYADFSAFSKVILILNMLLGRLEIFPLLILFTPKIWHRVRETAR